MRIWIRLWTEMLDDPKVGLLDDTTWRVTVSLFMLAGEVDQEGLLGKGKVIAWRLRRDEAQVLDALNQLSALGIVETNPEGDWRLCNFSKRNQRVEDKIRQQQHRKAARSSTLVSQPVTGLSQEWSQSEAEVEEEEESEQEIDPEKTLAASAAAPNLRLPGSPLEASQNREIMLYQKVTGIFPGEDKYHPIIESLQLIRVLQELPGEETLGKYLAPFWQAWKASRRKDGSLFDPFNLAWLTEWAVGGKIPARRRLMGPAPVGHFSRAGPSSLEAEIIRLKGQTHGDP
jgi:hypothetical protein